MTAPDSKIIVTAVPHCLPTPDSYILNQKASRLNTHLQYITKLKMSPGHFTTGVRFDRVHCNFQVHLILLVV